MRTSYLCLFALVLIGCDGKKEPAPQPPADNNKPASKTDAPAQKDSTPVLDIKGAPPATANPSPPAPQPGAGWTDNVQEMRYPQTAAAGRMLGKDFAPQSVELSRVQGRFLSLRQGDDFNPEFEVKILLSGGKDEKFSGKTFEIAPDAAPPVPGINIFWKMGDRQGEPKQFDGKYALRLEFGEESDGRIPGKIYLCLPDEAKSYVAGTFSAAVEPDYAQPPRPDEAPCVVGRITLPGKERISIVTGVIGQSTDGKRVTNLTGMEISPEIETSISSVDPETPSQRTSLVNDLQVGCQCRHARLPAGRYLVFVGTGERYIDWRWVEVKDNKTITIDFAFGPKQCGALEVVLPKDVKDDVRLIPLDEVGLLPDIKEAMASLSLAMKTDVTPKDGKVMLDGLRPGRYRVGAGAVEKNIMVKVNERTVVDLSAP